MYFLKNIIFFMLFYALCGQNLYALQTHHIMRNMDQVGREESEEERNRERIEMRKMIELERRKKRFPAFHIHEEIVCSDTEETPEEIIELVKKTRFSKKNIADNPLAFSVMTEVIKAHLHIAGVMYKKGKFIEVNEPRYHTDDEYIFYSDDVIKDTIYDVYKSPLYLKYVILPVIDSFMDKEEFIDTHLRLDFLSSPINLPTGMTSHRYVDPTGRRQNFKYYKAHINILMQRFDAMRAKYFANIAKPLDEKLMTYTAMALYHHAWQAYKNTAICTHYTKIIDPMVDTFDEELPDYHDTYVMGYGLLGRANDMMVEKIKLSQKFNNREKTYLLEFIEEFNNLYGDIILDPEKSISHAAFERKLKIFKLLLKRGFVE